MLGAAHRMLVALARSDAPMSVGEIAAAIGVDQPRASRLVQGAVEIGHVRREADPDDARRTSIVLTDAGRAHLEEARSMRRGSIETALAGFSDEERTQFAALLRRFVDAWPA
ncbi:winged helix-turn-helix transcriptional regulator [Agromyces archimandritae]|uniref:Winged helix-turn-helix transcriptional regulator n=2 Tax=Agromyces archimandritae TaxID=2781962 RepID=A0A975IQD7_9MICO|nr:winged helix-turn-helix transcriptional regulator [Agromyces archimandritae]